MRTAGNTIGTEDARIRDAQKAQTDHDAGAEKSFEPSDARPREGVSRQIHQGRAKEENARAGTRQVGPEKRNGKAMSPLGRASN